MTFEDRWVSAASHRPVRGAGFGGQFGSSTFLHTSLHDQFPPASELLQQADCAGEGLPVLKQANPASAEPDGQGKREPKAKATGPIHQAAKECRTGPDAETHNQVPQTILLGEERCESPARKRKEGKAPG